MLSKIAGGGDNTYTPHLIAAFVLLVESIVKPSEINGLSDHTRVRAQHGFVDSTYSAVLYD